MRQPLAVLPVVLADLVHHFLRFPARYRLRPMRIIVLGAGGAHKTETAIARAVRTLGHSCRQVNVVGWTRYLKGLPPPPVGRPRGPVAAPQLRPAPPPLSH